MKVCIDAGHGYNTPGKRNSIMREWQFNSAVATKVCNLLNSYGVQTYRSDDISGATDINLNTRVRNINAQDVEKKDNTYNKIRRYVMKFLKELFKRLKQPMVYTPIIGFVISIMVSSSTINIGSTDLATYTEKAIQLIGALMTVLGVANNPTDKENF